MANINTFKYRFELAPDMPSGLKYKIEAAGSGRAIGEMAGHYCKYKKAYMVMIRGTRYYTSDIAERLKEVSNGYGTRD